MHELVILQDLILIMGVSLPTIYILQRLHIPTIVGFLITGVLIGPSVLGLIHDEGVIRQMAEIGVVLLLFVVGLKFSIRDLMRMKVLVFGAGTVQVFVTIGIGTAIAWFWGVDLTKALFVGFLLALSSTAMLLKLLEERGELEAPQGRFSVGVLLLQDLAVIPMMLLVPVLSNVGALSWQDASWPLVRSFGLLAFFLAVGRFVFPWLLERVVRVRSREIFTLTVVLVALGTAYLAGLGGVSLALGAFFAGMIISESEYAYQIVSEVTPFYDIFSSVFFVSIGMLVDPRDWVSDPLLIFGLVFLVMALKGGIVALVALLFGMGVRVAILAGFALGQIGEFSFILAQAGVAQGWVEDEFYRQFLSVSLLTMALTPFALILSPWLARKISGSGRREARQKKGEVPRTDPASGTPSPPSRRIGDLKDHVVIVGYGVNGRNVAHILAKMGVSYLTVELNPFTVRKLRREGERVLYGDATRQQVLSRAGILSARALVLSIPDPASSRQILAMAKKLNPSLHVLVRIRFVGEVSELYRLGADQVVADEFESSLALTRRLMEMYEMSPSEVDKELEAIRHQGFRLLWEEPSKNE